MPQSIKQIKKIHPYKSCAQCRKHKIGGQANSDKVCVLVAPQRSISSAFGKRKCDII